MNNIKRRRHWSFGKLYPERGVRNFRWVRLTDLDGRTTCIEVWLGLFYVYFGI